MRNRLVITAAALLLSSQLGMAQTQPSPQTPQAPGPTTPSIGTFDFGFRGTSFDGDEARAERYQDLRNGLFTRLTAGKETDTYFVAGNAFNIGYRDQQYGLNYGRDKIRFNFLFDSTPTNFSYMSVTPWTVDDSGVLTIPVNLRQAVQGNSLTSPNDGLIGVICAPGGAPNTCNATNAPIALGIGSIYRNNLQQFDLRYKRETAAAGVLYSVTPEVDVNVNFTSTGRNGYMPWGASFAFNNANELPLPLDQRTNDFGVGAEWANQKAMLRVGWDGSWFNNNVQSLTWDNPIFATDFNNGLLPPSGPYDPSGYSNGNGPAQGRQALMPSNTANTFSATALYKLPHRSTVNGTFSVTNNNQDEQLIPWTINPLIGSNPAVLAAFPGLRELPRQTADAHVRGINALLNFNTRAWDNFGISAKFRYNDHNNDTPMFDAREYVRFDAVPEEIEEGESHYYQVTRKTFDVNGLWTAGSWGSARVGYTYEKYDREGRGFANLDENTFRVSWDTLALELIQIRAQYDFSARRGSGFEIVGVDYVEGPGGTQPTLRYYDEADRDRNRGSVIFTVMPRDNVDLYVNFTGYKDKFFPGEEVPTTRPNELFGLQNQTSTSINFGANVQPRKEVALGASYGYDHYRSLQKSRNANPPPDPTWTDPNRDWTLEIPDNVNSFNLFVDLMRAIVNTDVRVSYDLMDGKSEFNYGGPRVNPSVPGSLAALNQFIPVPDVPDKWHRLTADVKYFFRPNVGVGVAYWYQNYSVQDWATIDSNGPVGFTTETGTPRVDYLGGLITGYNPRDARHNTFFLRLLYNF